jgi:hypothetical protein
VFLIMGFAYSNTGAWILGFIFLAIGGYDLAKKSRKKQD